MRIERFLTRLEDVGKCTFVALQGERGMDWVTFDSTLLNQTTTTFAPVHQHPSVTTCSHLPCCYLHDEVTTIILLYFLIANFEAVVRIGCLRGIESNHRLKPYLSSNSLLTEGGQAKTRLPSLPRFWQDHLPCQPWASLFGVIVDLLVALPPKSCS